MSGFLSNVQSVFANLGTTFTNILNRIVPPEKRAEMLSKLKSFAINNPKLAVRLTLSYLFIPKVQFYKHIILTGLVAFLTTQIVLTGLPLILFITFTITVFIFSLVAALLIGLIAAVLFTLFMVGVALLVVLPTVFMTTFTATFLFLWGLGGYYILKWYNEGDSPAPDGTTIGDKINDFTGGRMSWLTDGVAKKQNDVRAGVDQTPRLHESESEDASGKGSGKAPRKLAEKPKENVHQQSNGVQKRSTKSAGGADNAASKVSEKTDEEKEAMEG